MTISQVKVHRRSETIREEKKYLHKSENKIKGGGEKKDKKAADWEAERKLQEGLKNIDDGKTKYIRVYKSRMNIMAINTGQRPKDLCIITEVTLIDTSRGFNWRYEKPDTRGG